MARCVRTLHLGELDIAYVKIKVSDANITLTVQDECGSVCSHIPITKSEVLELIKVLREAIK